MTRVVVVGAAVGGLAAAAVLTRARVEVTALEAHMAGFLSWKEAL